MAPFDMLPNELLEFVVGHVLDGKTNHFDYVATPVLQSVRLVCRTVCDHLLAARHHPY